MIYYGNAPYPLVLDVVNIFFKPLPLRTFALFYIDVTFNLPTFVTDLAFEIMEPCHLTRLGVKGWPVTCKYTKIM